MLIEEANSIGVCIEQQDLGGQTSQVLMAVLGSKTRSPYIHPSFKIATT